MLTFFLKNHEFSFFNFHGNEALALDAKILFDDVPIKTQAEEMRNDTSHNRATVHPYQAQHCEDVKLPIREIE